MAIAVNRTLTKDHSQTAMAARYSVVMVRSGLICLSLVAVSAQAGPLALSQSLSLPATPVQTRRLLLVDEATKNDVPFVRLQTATYEHTEEMPQLQLGQAGVVPSAMPINLQIEPLAGHLGSTSIVDIVGQSGFTTAIANNLLGVGITEAYGFAVSDRLTVSPFAALDYNRVDSTRLINLDSPRPFTNDNADTGLTATFGVAARPHIVSSSRLAPSAFAAIVFGSDNQLVRPREASSVGARIIQSIGSNGPEVAWSEFGTGVDYRLSKVSLIRASLIQTIGRPSGDGVAAQLVWRARW